MRQFRLLLFLVPQTTSASNKNAITIIYVYAFVYTYNYLLISQISIFLINIPPSNTRIPKNSIICYSFNDLSSGAYHHHPPPPSSLLFILCFQSCSFLFFHHHYYFYSRLFSFLMLFFFLLRGNRLDSSGVASCSAGEPAVRLFTIIMIMG